MPIITSLSTRFFGHPRLTNPTFVIRSEITLWRNSKFYHAPKMKPESATACKWRILNLVGGVRPRAQNRPNLLEQLPEPGGVARRAAKAGVHVELREFLHCRSKL